MAENGPHAEPTNRPFYKEFARRRKFVPNGIEKRRAQIFFGALQPKPTASAISLGWRRRGYHLAVL